MQRSLVLRIALWIAFVLFASIPILHVLQRSVSLISLGAYIASLFFAWNCLSTKQQGFQIHTKSSDTMLLAAFILITIGTLLYFGSYPEHYHQDEFITAFTSWSLPQTQNIDWFAAYPEIWVSQFPILFHILQKPWFMIFGPSVWAIRLSVLPYAMGIIIALFFLARMVGNRFFSLITLLLFIFFAPHLYLESTGLHFVSSSFFFIATLVLWIQFLRTKNSQFSILSGFFGACGFLTYTSSYMTLPVIFLSALLAWLTVRKSFVIQGFGTWISIWIAVMAPLLTYAIVVNNFFLQRISQVNIFSGSWSDAAAAHTPIIQRIATQTITAFQSLVTPHVGGIGGYHFGGMALLDIITAILMLIGILTSVREALIKRGVIHQTLLIALLLPFLFGLVLTTHPPPFHRISLLYPLMALYVGMGIWSVSKKPLILGLLFLLYIPMQWTRTQTMIRQDATLYPQNSRIIASYLMQHVPVGETVFIAAYPAFYLPQELLFRTQNTYTLINDTTEHMLPRYDGKNPIILLNPSVETKNQLQIRFPGGQFIQDYQQINLGDLTIFNPKQ